MYSCASDNTTFALPLKNVFTKTAKLGDYEIIFLRNKFFFKKSIKCL